MTSSVTINSSAIQRCLPATVLFVTSCKVKSLTLMLLLLTTAVAVTENVGLAQNTTAVETAAIRILENRCMACHGASQMSGLDMRERTGVLKGGSRGPAIVPGKAFDSLLYQASAHMGNLKMPPGSAKPLPDAELEALKAWINEGAVWPVESTAAKKTAEPSWWSFKKLRPPPLPHGSSGQNPIDLFVDAKLREKGLHAAPRADKQCLLRRAYFDLTGLPPTIEEANQFMNDSSADAYEKLIDQLLASPRYGERWARHWLDVVRYADSAGFEGDVFYPNAWRYRDYVIKSFNEDKPYDRFVQEQIAGDELWPDNLELAGFYDVPYEKLEHMEARIGTTVYTFGPEIQESHLDGGKLRYERLTDAVDTTASAFLGVTLGCARCHDHKFDPFPQKDYYRLQAIFAASQPIQVPVVGSMSATHRDEAYHWMIALDEARLAYKRLEKSVRDRVLSEKKRSFPPDVVQAFETAPEKRSPRQAELAVPLAKAYGEVKIEEHFTDTERTTFQELNRRIARIVLDVPQQDASHKVRFDGFFDLPQATVLGHIEPELIPDTFVLNRGDFGRNKSKVGPAIPQVLNDGSEPDEIPIEPGGARYRKVLALWLTRPDHPLTSRVMVNRIWQAHFGRGIVSTTNDFGRQGQPPTDQELLDWLASEFVAEGWSLKSMHRLIMLSEAYQRSSRFVDASNSNIDPENTFLWRANRRRLEAESIWDSIHQVAGTLNLKMNGRPVMPPLNGAELSALRVKPWWVPPSDPTDANRRAIYILSRRNFSFPMFDKFDRPDSAMSCPRRETTTVAPQALWTLNNETSNEQARVLAATLVKQCSDKPPAWIDMLWLRALNRQPSSKERMEAISLLDRLTVRARENRTVNAADFAIIPLETARAVALSELCLTVFNLNEFVFVD